MSRAQDILDEVVELLGRREEDYDDYHEMLDLISDYWSLYLGEDLSGDDVAVLMVLFKLARSSVGANEKTSDDLRDGIGYLAMASDLRSSSDGDDDLLIEEEEPIMEIVQEKSPNWGRTEDSFENMVRGFLGTEEFETGWRIRNE